MLKKIIQAVIVFLSLILLWQIVVWIFKFPPYILPGPWLVLKSFQHEALLIGTQSIPTIIETLMGLLIGCLMGITAALIMVLFRPLRWWLLPILLISQAIPTFAIAPLLVIWFGYGMASKIATTVIMLFFPVTSAFYDGLSRTPTGYLDLANTMHISRWRTLWSIRIPAALPALASGIRVATAFAPIGAIIGEWVGASKGLGFLMLNANARMQIALMFACLITLVIFSLLLYFIVDKLLQLAIRWQP